MMNLAQTIQAILFASPYALAEEELAKIIQKESPDIGDSEIKEELQNLILKFQEEQFGMEIQYTGMGYSFVTKPLYYPYIVNYIETIQKKRLSKSALETLSIIAFQPDCTKVDIEQIRGVSADYAIDRLIERELVYISGKKDMPGQPSTYATTPKFLDYFGMESLDQLPRLEFPTGTNISEIGSQENQDETISEE